jgi:membrane-associated phospholipid phosphatase
MNIDHFNQPIIDQPASLVRPAWDERLAYWISQIGCPPLTATAAVALSIPSLPATKLTWLWVSSYLILTILAPVLYLLWLLKQGLITDIHLRVRAERTRPLLVSLSLALLTWVLLAAANAPRLLIILAAATSLQTALFFIITIYWKISLHSASAAAMAVLAWLLYGSMAWGLILTIPLIAWARVRLDRHTLSQTVAGAVLGGAVLAAFLLTGPVLD